VIFGPISIAVERRASFSVFRTAQFASSGRCVKGERRVKLNGVVVNLAWQGGAPSGLIQQRSWLQCQVNRGGPLCRLAIALKSRAAKRPSSMGRAARVLGVARGMQIIVSQWHEQKVAGGCNPMQPQPVAEFGIVDARSAAYGVINDKPI